MNYRCLNQQIFEFKQFKIVPIREIDKYDIMEWRNEQIYHLRQSKPLSKYDQNLYFSNVVSKLFDLETPNQIIFSFLENDECIGYGGLVHINWIDKHAEISFIMDTRLESEYFISLWQNFLYLIEKVAFGQIKLHKIFTYAYDLRPKLYTALEEIGFSKEAILNEHCFYEGRYIDVIIHSKTIGMDLTIRPALENDIELLYNWANDNLVRQNSINTAPIEWPEHKKWFSSRINDKNCKILIFENYYNPIGQIRFEFKNDAWEIDYSIDSCSRGMGLGKKLIELGVKELPEACKLKAIVKKENIASCRVFEKLGFEKVETLKAMNVYSMTI